jgi:hypothetical protein
METQRDTLLNMTSTRLYLIEKYLQRNGKAIFGEDFEFKLDESYRGQLDEV